MLEILIVVLVIAADQATKAIAAKILPTLADSTYPLWEGVFHFTYVENRGAAFGMLQNKRIVFLVITSISIVLMIWLLISQRKRKPAAMPVLARAGIALILAGAVGNMIDRIWLGYVRDMLSFTLINFAVFNVADAAISVGGVLLVIDVLFCKKGKAVLAELDGKKDAPVSSETEKVLPKEDPVEEPVEAERNEQ